MLSKTRSEKIFEEFCQSNNLNLKSVPGKPNEKEKTPDYKLILDDLTVVVEVKQFDLNPVDKAYLRNLREKGDTGIIESELGSRVRKKIKDAIPQLKSQTESKHPAMLVLYDSVQLIDDIEGYNIRTGMYSVEQIDIGIPQVPTIEPYIIRHSFGKKQNFSQSHNTTLSCITVLRTRKGDEVTLDIYHNDFAAVPLDPNSLRLQTIRYYRLEATITRGVFRRWIEI